MKFLILFVAVAMVAADEPPVKEKRDLLLSTGTLSYAPAVSAFTHAAIAAPAIAARTLAYAAPAASVAIAAPSPSVAYAAPAATVAIAHPGFDDGQYFPGKYERPTFTTLV